MVLLKGTGAVHERGSLGLLPGGWDRPIAECGVRGLSVPKDLLQKGCALAFLGTAEAEGHTLPTPQSPGPDLQGKPCWGARCIFLLCPLPSTERVHSTTITNLVNRQRHVSIWPSVSSIINMFGRILQIQYFLHENFPYAFQSLGAAAEANGAFF